MSDQHDRGGGPEAPDTDERYPGDGFAGAQGNGGHPPSGRHYAGRRYRGQHYGDRHDDDRTYDDLSSAGGTYDDGTYDDQLRYADPDHDHRAYDDREYGDQQRYAEPDHDDRTYDDDTHDDRTHEGYQAYADPHHEEGLSYDRLSDDGVHDNRVHDDRVQDDGAYDERAYDDGADDDRYDEGAPDDILGYGAVASGHSAGAHRRGPPPDRGHHTVLITLAILAVIVVVGGGGFVLWAKRQITPSGTAGGLVTVVIPKGSSPRQIGSILASDGVIHGGSLFPYYLKLKGAGTLYPGTYRLARNESYGAAIAQLSAGPPVVQDRLVVPEGFTVARIAAAVAKLPDADITAAQFTAAADGGQVRSPFEPARITSLEGLLFPATYEVPGGQSASGLVQQMVDAFDANAAQAGLTAGAARLGLIPYQVVTVASMVEREAKRPQDRGPIASVIYNRLRVGTPLGIDSTLLYGLHTTDARVNPQTPSPYNTRIHPGLPPTPIASPGLSSLEAAVDPPATDYLYYAVTGAGGQTSFAATSAQFDHVVAQCRARGFCS